MSQRQATTTPRSHSSPEHAPSPAVEDLSVRRPLVLLTGNSNPQLAERIRQECEKNYGTNVDLLFPIERYADGEASARLRRSVRTAFLATVHSTAPPVDENVIELALMQDAIRNAPAESNLLVIPYAGYFRQDRATQSRQAISAKVMANIIQLGMPKEIIFIDIHAEPEVAFFDNRISNVTNLTAVPTLATEIAKHNSPEDLANTVVVSPDKGGLSRARNLNKRLGPNRPTIAFIDKERDPEIPDKVKANGISGNVARHSVILVDDILGTGGTLEEAARLCLEQGATAVDVAVTHALWADKAFERLVTSGLIRRIYVTDTVAQPERVLQSDRIVVSSVAPLIAEAIRRVHAGESVSELSE